MTSATVETAQRASQFTQARITFPRLVRAEWVKFRSLRSSWFTLAIALAIAVGLGALFAHLRGQEIAQRAGLDRAHFDATRMSLRGFMLAQLAVGVLGVLFITGEYATGMIRSTLTAAPRRLSTLLAKSLVLGVVTFCASLAASFAAFFIGQHLLGDYNLGVTLGSAGALRAVFGAAIYLTLVALLGLGCGFLVRSTGGAIATEFLLLLVLPLLGEQLPQSWAEHVNKYLPMNAGLQGMVTISDPASLAPWAGLAVLGVWAAVALVLGGVRLVSRDA